MRKGKLLKAMKEAHAAGEFNEVVDDFLRESAEMWINDHYPRIDKGSEACKTLAEAYRDGFYGEPLEDGGGGTERAEKTRACVRAGGDSEDAR